MGAREIIAGKASVWITANLKDLEKGLNRARELLKGFSAGVTALGTSMAAAGAAVGVPTAFATNVFADFESGMARVKALTGATGKDFDKLSAKALELGKATVFTSREAAEAMQYFALAGYDVNKILGAIGPTLDMAAAGQLGVAEAADITAKIMAGMGLDTSELGNAVDVLTKAMTTANTDLRQLGDAMKYVGPIAKNAGISLEETVGAIQMLSNAGIQADMAGTTLRGAILSLTDPSKEAAAELKAMNVATKDAGGNFRPLADIIQDMEAALSGMGSGDRLQKIGKIFDARQAAGFAELISQGSARLREFTAALQDAGGTAGRIAKTQLDTLKGDLQILSSAAEGAQISLGAHLGAAFRVAAQWLTVATNAAASFIERHGTLIRTVVGGASALGGLGAAFIAAGVAARAVATAIGGYVAVMRGLPKVLGVATAAIKAMSVAAAANPAIAALAALTTVVVALGFAVTTTTTQAAELNNEMRDLRKIGDELRASDAARAKRLQELAARQRLSASEMAEARSILSTLESRYGRLGITLDEVSGSINNAAVGFERLAASMIRAAQVDLDKDIAKARKNIEQMNKAIDAALLVSDIQAGGISSASALAGAFTGYAGAKTPDRPADPSVATPVKLNDQAKKLIAEREEALKELEGLNARMTALATGDFSAVSGGATSKTASAESVAERNTNAAKVDEEWARKVHQLKLQQIQDEHAREIALLNERYDWEEKRATASGAFEETVGSIKEARALELGQLEAKHIKTRADEEARLAQEVSMIRLGLIDKELDRQLATIQARYDFEIQQARAAGDDRKAQLLQQAQEAERAVARHTDALRQVERVRESDLGRAQTIEELRLQTTLKGHALEKAMLDLQKERAMQAARAAGESLALVEEEFGLREKLQDLDHIRETTRRAIPASVGTFSAVMADRISAGGRDPAEETAKATREVAKNTRELVDRAQRGKLVFG